LIFFIAVLLGNSVRIKAGNRKGGVEEFL